MGFVYIIVMLTGRLNIRLGFLIFGTIYIVNWILILGGGERGGCAVLFILRCLVASLASMH